MSVNYSALVNRAVAMIAPNNVCKHILWKLNNQFKWHHYFLATNKANKPDQKIKVKARNSGYALLLNRFGNV